MSARRYALFLGCTTPARALMYELSARSVAKHLDMEFVDFPEFTCCGYPTEALNRDTQKLISARNIAIAENANLEIAVLCSTCGTTLQQTNNELSHDKEEKEKVNEGLKEFDLEYKGSQKVRHFTRILYEDIGLERLRQEVTVNLGGLNLAADYGCHYLKPGSVFEGFEDPDHPHSLDDIIETTGAKSIDFEAKLACCGAAVLAVDESTSTRLSGSKLDHVHDANADGMVTQCQFCGIMYDEYQRFIGEQRGKNYNLPVLYQTQLLGWAFGLDTKKQLGFNMNAVKTTPLFDKLQKLKGPA